jgi:hypothetical protein
MGSVATKVLSVTNVPRDGLRLMAAMEATESRNLS